MRIRDDALPDAVNCRIGSLESVKADAVIHFLVNCRIGSLEKPVPEEIVK